MNRVRSLIWASLALSIMLIVASVSYTAPVTAQGNTPEPLPITYTPLPSPTNNGGGAQWTVTSMDFAGNFPKGAKFTLDASSSAGKITSAQVYWRHAPSYRLRRVGVQDPATGQFSAEWTAKDNLVPQFVSVEYWWDLVDEKGNNYETDHKFVEYEDTSRTWHRAESDDLVLIWQDGVPDSIQTDVFAAMKEGRTLYTKWWGTLLNFKPRAIIYADYKTVQEWVPGLSEQTRIVGATRAEWGGSVIVYIPDQGPAFLASVVRHEIGHLYQFYNGGASGPGADWFIEGDAVFQETQNEKDNALARARKLAASGDLPTLQDVGPSVRGDNIDGYDVGCAFFIYLEETYGPDAHYKVWHALASGKSRIDSIKEATGQDFLTVETNFRKWLGAPNAVPPTIPPTLTYVFPPSPTYPSFPPKK